MADSSLPASSVWLLSEIAESKGRQELYRRQAPQVLKALREAAIIQSTESSNRIEGVTVEPNRLRPLVLGTARPRNRSEQEIHGYREALNLIHTRAAELPVAPQTLLRLHGIIQKGSGDAGQWKRTDNEIVERLPGQAPVVRFVPVSAKETPAAVEELCRAYGHGIDQEHAPPLLAAACFVLDLLCIHPFRDGNGRVARLATILLSYRGSFEVGRYISLERLVEDSKEDYYEALRSSSLGWHEGKHDLLPWLNYFLTILRRAYGLFEERIGQVQAPRGAKRTLVEAAVEGFVGEFTLGEVEQACPGVSRDMVRRVMGDLRRAGKLECLGPGRSARWRKRG